MAEEPRQGWAVSSIVITVTVTVGLAVLAAFWALSDPRGEIKNIRENYLTVREHAEFVTRVQRDLDRIELENRRQIGRDEFEGRLGALIKEIEDLRRTSISKDTMAGHVAAQSQSIANIEHRIDQLYGLVRDLNARDMSPPPSRQPGANPAR